MTIADRTTVSEDEFLTVGWALGATASPPSPDSVATPQPQPQVLIVRYEDAEATKAIQAYELFFKALFMSGDVDLEKGEVSNLALPEFTAVWQKIMKTKGIANRSKKIKSACHEIL